MAENDDSFDCVAMKHRGAARVQKKIRGMTREEEIRFWSKGTRELVTLKRTAEKGKIRGKAA